MKDKFELGTIQKEWIKSLREHPERQMKARLGEGSEDNYRACCLGEWCVVYNRMRGLPAPFKDGKIISSNERLDGDTTLIGEHGVCFYSPSGLIMTPGASSLSYMNDSGKTWPQIADFVEANPEAVFIKSI